MDDVVLNKAAIIERCLSRVREVYGGDPDGLRSDLTCQESILLNIQRACEASIDLAMRLVRMHSLGLPQDSRDGFRMLVTAGLLDAELGTTLERMVGFRNIAVHEYQRLDLDIVQAIIERQLDDLAAFARLAVERHGLARRR